LVFGSNWFIRGAIMKYLSKIVSTGLMHNPKMEILEEMRKKGYSLVSITPLNRLGVTEKLLVVFEKR